MYLFDKTISNWSDWGQVFQDREAFTPLCPDILRSEGFPPLPLGPLTPGTNAVFRSGGQVLKVFYPPESGMDSRCDWEAEQAAMTQAEKLEVPAPKVLAAGERQDRYLFRYLIMDYCPGAEAGEAISKMTPAEKAAFARQVKALLARLNQPAENLIPPRDLVKQALENPRMNGLHPELVRELQDLAQRVDLSQPVLVHGDCTGENLLVDGKGKLCLIDFADCCLAPAWYELPPVVFELFREDPLLVGPFSKGENPLDFVEKLLWGLALHDFGGDILKGFFARQGIAAEEVSSLARLRGLLVDKLFGGELLPAAFPTVRFPALCGDEEEDIQRLYLENGKESTLIHVQAVAETTLQLARRFSLDPARCRRAALLHDIAAILPPQEMRQRAIEWGMPLDPAEDRYPFLLHQRFSAILAQRWLGVSDPLVLSAIECHTTLKPAPSPYDLALFLADKLSWDQDGEPPYRARLEREMVVSLERAALAYLDEVIGEGKLLFPHHLLIQAHQYLRGT